MTSQLPTPSSLSVDHGRGSAEGGAVLDDAHRGHSAADPACVTVFLPITAVAPVRYDDAVMSMCSLLDVYGRALPLCSIGLVVVGGGEVGCCAFEVSGPARDVENGCILIRSAAPWVEAGDPTIIPPWGQLAPPCHRYVDRAAVPVPAVSLRSSFWRATMGQDQRWAVRAAVSGAEAEGPLHDRTVWADVILAGSGSQAGLLAEMMAAEIGGPVRLVAEPLRHPEVRTPVPLPLVSLAHLLATPARLPQGFLASATSEVDLREAFRSSPSPHSLIIGASGQGKSTLMEHLIEDSCQRGEQVVVIDGHDGRLADFSLARCLEAGADPVYADFSAVKPPGLPLTAVPGGLSPEMWASELYCLIRAVLWSDMPAEYFGPVAERGLRLLLEIIVRARLPIADLTRLADPGESGWRDRVLERIGDPALARAVRAELMPMLSARDAGNATIFLTSKLDPIIGDGFLRPIVSCDSDGTGLGEALRAGQPFVAFLPPGRLGDAGSRVLGALFLQRLWLSRRGRVQPETISVFLDEWQRYAVTTIGAMLAEGRKFNLRLTLANQTLAQLSPGLCQTVLANLGCLASFRTGPMDAGLVQGMYPTLSATELERLGPHQVAITTGDKDWLLTAPPPLSWE